MKTQTIKTADTKLTAEAYFREQYTRLYQEKKVMIGLLIISALVNIGFITSVIWN